MYFFPACRKGSLDIGCMLGAQLLYCLVLATVVGMYR